MDRIKAVMIIAFAFAATVFAQDAWDSEVVDFGTPERPARLAADGGDPDFGAALDAAAAAEGRSTAKEPDKKEPEKKGAEKKDKKDKKDKKEEFTPKNEIIITKKPVEVDTAKKQKASGPKLGNTVGGRLGLGNINGLDIGFGFGLSEAMRLNLGAHFGTGTPEGFRAYILPEVLASVEWIYPISDDKALSWFFGPAVAAWGYHSTSGDEKVFVPVDTSFKYNGNQLGYMKSTKKSGGTSSVGVGGRVGLEVDLGIIDPDHSLSFLRSCSVGLDLRPIIYFINLDKFPDYVMTMGLTFNYEFGKTQKLSGAKQ